MKKATLKDLGGSEERFSGLVKMFRMQYSAEPERFFSAPGRTEVCGNHTDHNRGKVVAAAVDLDVIAAVVPTSDGVVAVKSEGYPEDVIEISDLSPKDEEKNTSAALIRGVLGGFVKNGRNIGGFRAYTRSNVLKGSGLSSSAAFEVLIGTILNGLYNGGEVSEVEIAKTAQYAENVYFGKPSGLMDQMASSIGGFTKIDFKDPENPIITPLEFDPAKYGYRLCIIDSKSDHADLTPDYAAIPAEMKSAAKCLGKEYLRETDRETVIKNISKIRSECGDRAALRALHFMDENDRVDNLAEAIEKGDISAFLKIINLSGDSSYKYLQNVFTCAHPDRQGVSLAICLASSLLGGEGACRVHGGGFAGTVQAFVPEKKLEGFIAGIEEVFGEGSCYVLNIRPYGGTEVSL